MAGFQDRRQNYRHDPGRTTQLEPMAPSRPISILPVLAAIAVFAGAAPASAQAPAASGTAASTTTTAATTPAATTTPTTTTPSSGSSAADQYVEAVPAPQAPVKHTSSSSSGSTSHQVTHHST